ncbi:MAG: outer membrane protein assembly factor BamB family protein, partial [Planctomycetota bacterium]
MLLFLLLYLPAAARSGEGDVRLLTDEAIPRYLARGRELARAEEWDKMVDVLQRVIVGDKEIFPDLQPALLNSVVYTEDDEVFYPARELCLRELASLPPEGLQAYRDIHDAPAQDLFTEAEAIEDIHARLAAYTRVFDRYLVSSVGDDALEKAADLNLELGRYYESLALFRRLLDIYPKDSDRDRPTLMAKAAYSAVRIGDIEQRDELLDRLAASHPNARLRIEGETVAAADLKQHPRLQPRSGPADGIHDADWPVPGGDASRSRVADELPEHLPAYPFWQYPLGARSPRLHSPHSRWRVQRHDREKGPNPAREGLGTMCTSCPTVRPVLYDGLVLYKDGIELVARRVGSGHFTPLRSRYDHQRDDQSKSLFDDPGFFFPVERVRPGTTRRGNLAQRFEDIYRYLDYGGGCVVASGDRLISVENQTALDYLLPKSENTEPPGKGNTLAVYDRVGGKLIWGWEGKGQLAAESLTRDPAALERWHADHQEHPRPSFLGPGVVSGGTLYTIAYKSSHDSEDNPPGVFLWAFDLRDGRVRFRTQIHYPDTIPRRLPRGAALAMAGGAAYLVTQSGVVAAVDALPPGRVRWIARYKRAMEEAGRASRRRMQGPKSSVKQTFAYNDPIIAAGKVIVAPADSAELIAFNAESGRPVWRIPRTELRGASYIVGVSGGVLVLGGDKVYGIDVATGKDLWNGPRRLGAFAYGRGLVGRRYAYIPSTRPGEYRAQIHRFDLKTGELAPALKFNVQRLGNLLAVDGRLIVANEDEVMCFTTLVHELQRIDDQVAQKGDSAELRFERALVSLASNPPHREKAREDFRRAVSFGPTSEVVQRAVENLFAIALEKMDYDALEEADALLTLGAPVLPPRLYRAQAEFLKCRILANLGRAREAFDCLEGFLDEYTHAEVVDADQVVQPAAAAARRVRTVLVRRNAAFREVFTQTIRDRIRTAFEHRDKEALAAIPIRYDNAPPTEESYFTLARLHAEEGDSAAAELALRTLVREYPDHPSRGEAHLRLARMLLNKRLVDQARRERDQGVSRLVAGDRERLADLLDELDANLAGEEQHRVPPTLSLPLRAAPLGRDDAAPVEVEADPRGITLLATINSYIALDAKSGETLWTKTIPSAEGVRPGPADDPGTSVVAAAIHQARFARAVGDQDILVGDIYGLMRLDAKRGIVRWQYPKIRGTAAVQARQLINALEKDLYVLGKGEDLPRRNAMPLYAMAGENVVVSVHPLRGLEVIELAEGQMVWVDTGGISLPFGAPQLLGQLLVQGWTAPGRVRVYDLMAEGRNLHEHKLKEGDEGVLFSPPVLDRMGRLYLVAGKGDENLIGELRIVDVRSGAPAHDRTYPFLNPNAALLFTDGKTAAFHDGSSGHKNLYLIDLQGGSEPVRLVAADLLRQFHVLQEG